MDRFIEAWDTTATYSELLTEIDSSVFHEQQLTSESQKILSSV